MKYSLRNFVSSNVLLITIISVYILSRLYFYLILQLEFSYHLKDYLIQYLDVTLLKDNLLESILYLHSQPPLFNFLIGVVEILFGEFSYLVFFFFFQIVGLMTAILSYKTLILLDVHKKLAFIFILLYILTPATILYENLFFYTHPIIFFLVFSGYFLLVYYKKRELKNLVYFFTGISLSILTTSFFHIVWFIIILIVLLVLNKGKSKIILKAASFPFVLILALYVKNFLLFNEFGTSSWLGMNLSRITVQQLDKKLKAELINKEELSEISEFPSFTHLTELYSIEQKYFKSKTRISVLDQTVKKSGRTNFNNSGYIAISKLAFSDAIYVIQNYPQVYLTGIEKAFMLYFDSPTKYKLLRANLYKLKNYNKFYDAFVYGSSFYTRTGYFSIIFSSVILIISLFLLVNKKLSSRIRAFIIYALINILYVMFVGNLLELGENNRFRFYTEIFNFLLLGIIINELIIKKFTYNPKQI